MTVAPFDVSLDNHGYMLDLGSQQWKHESIPLLRPMFISSDSLGEKDINPETNWRFSDRDWSHGAGQRRADMPDSDTSRFWRSRGVDVWTRYQASLLPQLTAQTALVSERIFVVGGITYWVTPALQFGSPGSPSTIAASGIFDACTDGATVYYTDSLTIESAAVGSTSHTTYNTLTGVDQLYYCNGRLVGYSSSSNKIFDIQSPAYDDLGGLPERFLPVDMTAGLQAIYIAAVNIDKGLSQVFALTIKTDGTGLNPPVAVTPPFDGTLRRVLYYEGLVFLGAVGGIRMCSPSADGLALTIGPLINPGLGRSVPTSGNCSALAGHGGQVWFGIDMYELDDSGVTYWSGMGRIDPTVIHDDGSPAWAADVMASGFGYTPSPIITDAAFSADGSQLTVQTRTGPYTAFYGNNVVGPTFATSGYIDSGLISYDLPDDKAARYLTIKTGFASAGDITPSIAVDGSDTFVDQPVVAAGVRSQRSAVTGVNPSGEFEIRETLARNADDATQGAVLTRHMLESDPIVASGFFLYVPLLLADPVADRNGSDQRVDVIGERAYLYALRENGTAVTYSELGYPPLQVTVEDLTWVPTHRTEDSEGANGTLLLKLKTI